MRHGSIGVLLLALPATISFANIHRAPTPASEPAKGTKFEDRLREKLQDPFYEEFYSVRDIIQSQVTGLDFESTKIQEEVKKDINWFTHRLAISTPTQRATPDSECNRSETRKALCEILKPEDPPDTFNADSHGLLSLLRTAHRRLELNSSLRNLNIGRLVSAPADDLRKSLSKQTNPALLQALAKRIQEVGACTNPALTQLLAFRMEELQSKQLPLSSIVSLYNQAAECSEGGEFALRAKYRLALLNLWQGNISLALPILTQLSRLESRPDYQVRGLYWKARCELELKQPEDARSTHQQLQKKYPFSLHALLAAASPFSTPPQSSLPKDAGVQFRSSDSAKTNNLLRIAEAFTQKGERKLALKVLDAIEPLLENSEPELKLYLSILHARLSNHIKNFQLLAGIFKDDQSLISKSTLELFYPTAQFPKTLIKGRQGGGLLQSQSPLILSLIRQESAFNTRAQSPVGALGLMQLMPSTAKRFEKIKSREQLFDPRTNIRVGTKYFSTLLTRYSYNAELALAAYNAGPKKVDQWIAAYPTDDPLLFIDLIPYKETREYVASIARNYYWYQALYPSLTKESTHSKPRQVGKFFSALVNKPTMTFD